MYQELQTNFRIENKIDVSMYKINIIIILKQAGTVQH